MDNASCILFCKLIKYQVNTQQATALEGFQAEAMPSFRSIISDVNHHAQIIFFTDH
jgi:hypothetical protein